jgi:hypothetical protein
MAGTYQSRVFNFINGQTNRVKNSLSQGWRRVKISAQWTGQILLAPLRWLSRFSQDTDRQIPGGKKAQLLSDQSAGAASDSHLSTATAGDLRTASARNASKAIAGGASKAIEALLAEVAAAGYGLLPAALPLATTDDWSVIDENEWDTAFLDEKSRALTGKSPLALPSRPVIQGLATLLSNQNLVLIDQHNQILDVLSPSQQLHIRQQIGSIIKRSLPPVANQQLPHAQPPSWPAVIPPAVLAPLPARPRTLFQKLGYWSRFYLEYFRVDVGQAAVDSDPIPHHPLMLWSPLHKSLAVIPQSIDSLAPEVESLLPVAPASSSDGKSQSIAVEASNAIDISSTKSQSQVSFQPEWIEAPTETLGYERSLLGQLWQWLDRLMLTIENWIISIYERFKGAR